MERKIREGWMKLCGCLPKKQIHKPSLNAKTSKTSIDNLIIEEKKIDEENIYDNPAYSKENAISEISG